MASATKEQKALRAWRGQSLTVIMAMHGISCCVEGFLAAE